ncbi:TATA element modulatory factor [Lachnellula subtilissima]|uniref:TATA element modulatory factor n=1 Tax=Lachnellula subtilissima TaxID=602034 RepID=A0A8H8UBL0_9HELO|nr:TATA element modulatory factor [Lachnellula subtilissima]
MAAPSKQSSSRWGSFLQQAVAGVESRLDTILAEGDEAIAPTSAKRPTPTSTTTNTAKAESVSRTSSTSNRTNDRLQERLARAIAAKNSAQKGEKVDSPALSATPSRTGSPVTATNSPRQSTDVGSRSVDSKDAGYRAASEPTGDDSQIESRPSVDTPSIAVQPGSPRIQPTDTEVETNGLGTKAEAEASPRPSGESTRSSIPRASMDSTRTQGSLPRSSTEVHDTELLETVEAALKSPEEYDALLKQLQSDFEKSELQRQEEVHDYIERIDALQSKLQYLAKESVEAARKASSAAPAGSLEKKLADKEQQVALLMEEGQSLSKKELTHMTTIKKLRAKIQENNKEISEAKSNQEKAEKDAASVTQRLKRAQASERQLGEKQKQIAQLQRDVESLKSERDAKDSAISDLRQQLEEAATQEKEAENKRANEALDVERRKVADLEEDLANLSIEKSLVSDRSQSQIRELREKMDKDAERARAAELEMKTEQQMLESKLEVMRARAEEVSSGTTGDAQAKLLRQIETLQSQYAVASENWQGIEASLVARATNLEKERDEAAKREADIRRKAREVTLKAKRNEDELEETRSKLPSFEQELAEYKSKLDTLKKKAEASESALIEARTVFDQEKQAWQMELLQRVEEERHKWQEEASGSLGHSRAESPVPSQRRGLTTEFLGLQNLQMKRTSARSITSSEQPSAFQGRRPSVLPLGRISGNGTPTRQDSAQSYKDNGECADTPSIHTTDHDQDDFFENNISTSPHQTINDMISVSTAGAGPTVQLVERMSSAVRRLESEKVATKEDLARLSAQRDEARAEIVALMREVQAKRDAETKVGELEKEMGSMNDRYQTTLEMLGEKSEMVDELRSDIDDIKAMYRELVERTVK